MSALLAFLVAVVREVLAALAARKTTAEVTHGTTALDATPLPKIFERARRSGLLLVVGAIAVAGCGSTHVVVATLHPVEDATKGWPRIAQDSVKVVLDGSGTIGEISPAGGYFLIHEADLKALLNAKSRSN